MSKKKTGKREAKGKSGKTARRPGGKELTDEQLAGVAGGVDSFAGIKGESTSKEHEKHIEIVSYSFGAAPPPGGLKSR